MTDREIFNLNEGDLVRIKDGVKCHESYKKPCKITFKNSKKLPKKEYQYGIIMLTEDGKTDGVCYYFHSSEYEIVQNE